MWYGTWFAPPFRHFLHPLCLLVPGQFPKNLETILGHYKTILIPEINNGQLIKIIRDKYLVDARGYNKIMGVPITKTELVEAIKAIYPSSVLS